MCVNIHTYIYIYVCVWGEVDLFRKKEHFQSSPSTRLNVWVLDYGRRRLIIAFPPAVNIVQELVTEKNNTEFHLSITNRPLNKLKFNYLEYFFFFLIYIGIIN